jgi:hypothetical protein
MIHLTIYEIAAIMMCSVVEDVINPIFAERGFPKIGFHIGPMLDQLEPVHLEHKMFRL